MLLFHLIWKKCAKLFANAWFVCFTLLKGSKREAYKVNVNTMSQYGFENMKLVELCIVCVFSTFERERERRTKQINAALLCSSSGKMRALNLSSSSSASWWLDLFDFSPLCICANVASNCLHCHPASFAQVLALNPFDEKLLPLHIVLWKRKMSSKKEQIVRCIGAVLRSYICLRTVWRTLICQN